MNTIADMTPAPGRPADDEPPWLDEDQQRAWRNLVELIMTLSAALDNDFQERAGLTTFEYLVLSQVSECPWRAMRLSALAAAVHSSLSRLSHVVSRLEARE